VSTQINVTRKELVERRWECPHCKSYGVVMMRAHGESGWRRIGLFQDRDAVEADAADDASWSVQRDAERMMAMIECPVCKQRAPRVMFWSVVRTVWPVLASMVTSAVIWVLLYFWIGAPWWVLPILLASAVAFGIKEEIRRWRTAGRTRVESLRQGQTALPVAVASQSKPPVKPIAIKSNSGSIAPIASSAPQVVQASELSDGPRFLKD
jgi:hypothetical protein